MKKTIFFMICVLCMSAGCRQNTDTILNTGGIPVDLVNPNGVYEYVLYTSAEAALSKIDFSKYKDKKIVYTLTAIAGDYTKVIFEASLKNKFMANKASAAVYDNKANQAYDYSLTFSIPICGIHEYPGLVKTNIRGIVLVNVVEVSHADENHSYSSGVIETAYDKCILNQYAIIVFWTFIGFLVFIVSFIIYRIKFCCKKTV